MLWFVLLELHGSFLTVYGCLHPSKQFTFAGIKFPRMSGLHWQEQFSSKKGKTEQQRSLCGGSPERRPDCGTCSAHRIPAFAPSLSAVAQ